MVDSLTLDKLSNEDKDLLESSLKKYHASKEDIDKINALQLICESMSSSEWEKYQWFQYSLIKKNLKIKFKNEKTHQQLINREAGALNNIGYIYMKNGNIPNAIETFHKALKAYENTEDKYGMASALSNLGYIYGTQGEIETSLKQQHRSLELFKELNDLPNVANTLNNIGFVYMNHNQNDTALAIFRECLKTNEELGNTSGIATNLNNIGIILKTQGKIDEALEAYYRGLELHSNNNNKKGEVTILHNIGLIEFNRGNTQKAKVYGEKAFKIVKEFGFPEDIKGTTYLLYLVYEKLANGKKALEMYKLHIQMRDSINNEETQKAAIRQQTQYEFEKEQIRKENEAKEKARIEAEELKRRNNMEYSLIFLGILVLFGIVLMLGFIKVSPNIAEGLIFFAFLIFFEFLLVFTEPYLEQYTQGEPVYALLANSALALIIFPLHAVLERLLKKRIVK